MPAVQPGAWGIDIGQCALKAIRLANINGTVTATAFDFVEHPKRSVVFFARKSKSGTTECFILHRAPDADGKFDGKDLYAMARGCAISDASTSTANFNGGTLNATAVTFGEKISTAQLRKNDALEYMNTMMSLPAFQEWTTAGLAETLVIEKFETV